MRKPATLDFSPSPRDAERRYIIIVGSLLSGLGKGIVTASIGKILQSRGLKVVPIKFDGYLNVDCGTMNPFRHGEVFVLDDGNECDMDLGTYERFLDLNLNYMNNMTGGKIFSYLIEKERCGGYLGVDVQIVPHLTGEIKKWVTKVGSEFDSDVVLVEVGGTAGDLENSYFIEAMRELSLEKPGKVMFVQLTFVPTLSAVGEQKTKPTQHATRLLQGMGIQPDVVICREEERLTPEARRKISLFCNVPPERVIDDPDCETIYEVPEVFQKQGLSEIISGKLGLRLDGGGLAEWNALVKGIKSPKKEATVGITGKYTALKDSYVSIKEALAHAGGRLGCAVKVKWIETTEIEADKSKLKVLEECDGIIVPGGYGSRGTEGKIECIRYARANKIPFLGLCFGMQLAVVEYARHACGLKDANSTEINPNTKHPVIDVLPEQKALKLLGGTQRLGAYPAKLVKGTRAHAAYGTENVSERHRHRWELNADYRAELEKCGLVVSGTSPDGEIVEFVEWKDSFGVATQAHPEFKSRLEKPAPLFIAFLKAALEKKAKK
ncbi:MAG: CTP synthase [Candidatus ainarchaeum sp.]|nr:CTP synthase [Candidatus ainarchaeum sp.]